MFEIFIIFVLLVVVVIFEGFFIIVMVILVLGVYWMVKYNVIVCWMLKVEMLGFVNVVCIDKMGILIMNYMIMIKIWIFGNDDVFNVDLDEELMGKEFDVVIYRILCIGNIVNNVCFVRNYNENGFVVRVVFFFM